MGTIFMNSENSKRSIVSSRVGTPLFWGNPPLSGYPPLSEADLKT